MADNSLTVTTKWNVELLFAKISFIAQLCGKKFIQAFSFWQNQKNVSSCKDLKKSLLSRSKILWNIFAGFDPRKWIWINLVVAGSSKFAKKKLHIFLPNLSKWETVSKLLRKLWPQKYEDKCKWVFCFESKTILCPHSKMLQVFYVKKFSPAFRWEEFSQSFKRSKNFIIYFHFRCS